MKRDELGTFSTGVTQRGTNYDKRPVVRVAEDARACREGWAAIAAAVRDRVAGLQRAVVVVECYPGVDLEEARAGLEGLLIRPIHTVLSSHPFPQKDAEMDGARCVGATASGAAGMTAICAERALKAKEMLEAYLEPWLGDDPVFGRMREWQLGELFDAGHVEALRASIAVARGPVVVVYGAGAALVAGQWDVLVYCDVTRWEIQQRQREHRGSGMGAASLGAENAAARPAELYKRGFFVDWRAADAEKHRLHGGIDFYVDTNVAGKPVAVEGEAYRQAMAAAVKRPFRVVPFFDPGPWGGEWMRRKFDLPEEAPNFAWCFDCVPEENSVCFGFGDVVVEAPALGLVHEHPRELLGEDIYRRFGAEFPIRFDFLDTMEGGNLSLQVHPLKSYIAEKFGMKYTQDESYYLLDAGVDAQVFLGLKTGVDRDEMARELREAEAGGAVFAAEKYVNAWPAKKHDHFSIPAGTVHCSGRNGMVLEISATPYIFTFKLWDWGRLGLDGRPRPIHMEHGLANIQWERQTDWVGKNLVSPVEPVAEGEGWREERTGLHALEFLETRRHWFTQAVEHDTAGTLNVLNLVEGDEAVVESPEGAFEPFTVHYAETFIVPAAVGRYRIRPVGEVEKPLGTVKAYVRRAE
ncbi:MAG: class I mannose-6-phosphate isomerase [Terracidiphilus sp.]|nr:class I mannose-6-phosphate isomerase [Terracidiphilus sp.]